MGKLDLAPFKGMEMANILEAYDFAFSSEEKNEMVNSTRKKTEEIYEQIKDDPSYKGKTRILMTGGPI